jgi:hypothetical protein
MSPRFHWIRLNASTQCTYLQHNEFLLDAEHLFRIGNWIIVTNKDFTCQFDCMSKRSSEYSPVLGFVRSLCIDIPENGRAIKDLISIWLRRDLMKQDIPEYSYIPFSITAFFFTRPVNETSILKLMLKTCSYGSTNL